MTNGKEAPVSGIENVLDKQVHPHGEYIRPAWVSLTHPFRLWVGTVGSIFLTETLVTLTLSFFPFLPSLLQAVLDASLLSVLMGPLLLFLFRSMTPQLPRRRRIRLAVREILRIDETSPRSFLPDQDEVNPPPKTDDPLRLLAIAIGSAFVTEAVVMVLLSAFPPLDLPWQAIVDASLLSAVMVPLLFFSLFRPMSMHLALRKRALQELRKFTSAVEQSPAMVLFIDTDNKIEYANIKFTQVTGYAPEEVIGTDPRILDAEDNPEKYRRMREALSQGREWRGEFHNRKKTGELYWTSASISPVKNPEGTTTHYLSIQEDITERKRAEEALRESEENFRSLAERSPNMIFINSMGRVVYANELCQKVTGYTREELCSDDFDFRQLIAPESLRTVNANFERHLRGEDIPPYEYTLVTKGGERIDAIHATKLIHFRGSRATLGIVTDITERKRAEEALRESEQKFRSLFDLSPQPIALTDLDTGRLIEINDKLCEVTKYRKEEILGRKTTDCLYSLQDRARLLKELSESGEIRGMEMEFRAADGLFIHALVFAKPVCINGEVFLLTMFQDVTEQMAAQEALRRSERRLAEAQRIAQLGNWDWNLRTNEMHFSAELHRIVGRDLEAYRPGCEGALESIIHPEDRLAAEKAITEMLGGTEKNSLQCRIVRPNGEVRVVHAQGEVTLDKEGMPVQLIGTVLDITDRKRAEEKIDREKEFSHVLIGSSLDGIFAFDRQGRITVWNPEMERLFGISKAEALGRQPFEVLPTLTAAGGEDLLAKVFAGEKIVAESRAQAVTGMERFFEGRYTPVVEKQGIIIGGLGIIRDTSEKKRTEQEQTRLHAAIEKSALEWRQTFDAVESPILILDLRGRIIRINRATMELLGSSYEKIVGRRIEDVGAGEPWVAADRLVGDVRESGRLACCQVRDDGSRRSWDVSASLYVTPGMDRRFIVVASDITRLVELQETLRRNEVMSAMGSLVAGVAHGVRNPLFAISASLDAFEARFGDREDFRKYGAVFRRELDRLSKLMHDLLQYGRPGSEAVTVGCLGDILNQAVSSCSAHAERMNVRIDRSVDTELSPTVMHGTRLLLVFENILENAIAHSPPGRSVKVVAKQIRENGEAFIHCVVEDAGPGFPKEALPRLFEPFFTRRSGGTGLGLSIARRIVEEHNGTITARNRSQGGAAIEVRLPNQPE